ncbi:Uncharacterised protein g8563 [Pycnogonum litorale]
MQTINWRSCVLLLACVSVLVTDVSGAVPAKCQLQKDPGHCYASIPKYYYDVASSQCKSFIYGGCGGNANRFEHFWQCQKSCNR